ncbi:MAG: MFS transporter [Acidimicrobiia bacterium]|nr:MFS transporter [Acidimicrobiia bacterium]
MRAVTHRQSRTAYFAIFLVTGTTFGVVGPSLPLLAEQIGSTVAGVGTVLMFYGGGYLTGTRLFVRGYDRGWGNRLIGVAGLLAAASFASISLGQTLTALCVAFFFFGAAISTSDVGCNTMMMWEKKEQSGPSIALMHAMFGVGAIASPFIVRVSDSLAGDAVLAYFFCAILAASAAMFVLTRHSPEDPHVEVRELHGDISIKQIAVIVMYFFAYVAVEVAFATWIYTYGTRIGMPKIQAALLNSLFWVGFMVGRFATVWLAKASRSARPVQIGAIANVFACLVMLTRVDVLLLPVVFVYGLATAPQFSLMLAFIGSRIPLSGKMTSRIVGSAGLSSTVMPWFVGQLLERVSLWTYPVALICCSATVLVMAQIIEAKLPHQLNASV